jgi:hypothetical protein
LVSFGKRCGSRLDENVPARLWSGRQSELVTILNEHRLFPGGPCDPRHCSSSLFQHQLYADPQPARPHRPRAGFADNKPFLDPAQLFLIPDHYVYRMLYSQGVPFGPA